MLTINERLSPGIVSSTPLSFLWLEITGKCNLACEHCYAGSSPQGTHGAMRRSQWEQVITEAASMGCQRIQFIGGEPTTHPDLDRFIRLATALEMHVEVYTNLVSVKNTHWQTFRDCNVHIATSFYSLHATVHEQITNGRESFHKTVHNIRQVIEYQLPLRVGLIEMHAEQDIEETTRFLRDLGVSRIGHDQVRAVGRGTQLIQVHRPEEALCGACAQGKAAVVPSGDVYPCVFSRHLRIGNVLRQSFTDVMQSDRTRATRATLQAFFMKRRPQACNPPSCGPEDCEPFCEPYDCSPDIPPCRPDTLCLPDFRERCKPEAPCSPDEEKCPPDWDS